MRTLFAVILSLSFAAAAASQTTPASPGPDFKVQIWGETVADFNARVQRYYAVRRALEVGLPPLVLTDDPDHILTAEVTLARAIRRARTTAREGDIFTPEISAAFRNVLLPVMTGQTLAVIMDENPGRFSHRIDGTYPKEKPRATIPWTVLSVLPPLPDDMQYGFVGRYLILHDIRANVIVDRTCAIQCDSTD
jgi:hypothetical protein